MSSSRARSTASSATSSGGSFNRVWLLAAVFLIMPLIMASLMTLLVVKKWRTGNNWSLLMSQDMHQQSTSFQQLLSKHCRQVAIKDGRGNAQGYVTEFDLSVLPITLDWQLLTKAIGTPPVEVAPTISCRADGRGYIVIYGPSTRLGVQRIVIYDPQSVQPEADSNLFGQQEYLSVRQRQVPNGYETLWANLENSFQGPRTPSSVLLSVRGERQVNLPNQEFLQVLVQAVAIDRQDPRLVDLMKPLQSAQLSAEANGERELEWSDLPEITAVQHFLADPERLQGSEAEVMSDIQRILDSVQLKDER